MKRRFNNYLSAFCLFLSLLFVSVGTQAQTDDRTPLTAEERAQKWTSWMKNELQLTIEQENAVHPINVKYAQQNEVVRLGPGSKAAKFRQVKSNDSEKDLELKGLLTTDQFNKYQEKKKEFQRKMLEAARASRE